MLYQTEPHSDLEAGLIGGGFGGRKRLFSGSCDGLKKVLKTAVASVRVVSYLHRLAGPNGVPPFLLGNGVMVTLRFLVPSF